jgi:hypothetical protein
LSESIGKETYVLDVKTSMNAVKFELCTTMSWKCACVLLHSQQRSVRSS